MPKVIILDYHSGNLFSVQQALRSIGVESSISSNVHDIESADALIFPGMGAFGAAMNSLRNLGLDEPIKKFVASGKPFLGICLGMQLLFTESDEFGITPGLGIIEGRVPRFENVPDLDGRKLRVPQIAWNTIQPANGRSWSGTPLEGIEPGAFMYFVHSFYVQPADNTVTLSQTEYGGKVYTSSLLYRNIFACQFHPEKSGVEGLKIYKNWAIQNNLLST